MDEMDAIIWKTLRNQLEKSKDPPKTATDILYGLAKPIGAILADLKASPTVVSVGQVCPADRTKQWAAIVVTNEGCDLLMAAIKPVVAEMAKAMRMAGKTIQVTGITETTNGGSQN